MVTFCDIINSIFQSFIFVYYCNKIVDEENRLSSFKVFITTLFIFLNSEILTYSGLNMTIANVIMVLVSFIILFISLKNIKVALVGLGMGYFIITLTTYTIVNIYNGFTSKINIPISAELKSVLLLYIPIMLLYIPLYRYRALLFNAGKRLINAKNSIAISIIFNITLILFNAICMDWFFGKLNVISRAILYGVIFACFLMTLIYFSKIYGKSKEVEMLNIALENKISELRQIKHDYGSQITILYNLAQNKNIDKLTSILESIIIQNEQVNCTIELQKNSSPLLLALLKNANSLGIQTIVDSNIDIENLNIETVEIINILTNIINNAIQALKYKPDNANKYIKLATKQEDDFYIIIVENNGEQISSKHIDKIFNQGFTTKKENVEEHGFGLFICKQIIEKYEGIISVESNEDFTRFIIKIPIKLV
jgi:anti-sigma regulatory factor (Ser/Thr protein kinase)